MYIVKQVLKSRHVFHSTLLTLSFDRNMLRQHYALNAGVCSFPPFFSWIATLLKVCLVFLFTLLSFRTYSYYQRLSTFAMRTAASGVENSTGGRRCLALLHSTAAAAVLHKLCAALPPTSKSFSRLNPTQQHTGQLPTGPSKRDNMPKIEFSNTASKIITRIYKGLSHKLLPNFHIFQSSEFWTSYLMQLNLVSWFWFFQWNYNDIWKWDKGRCNCTG